MRLLKFFLGILLLRRLPGGRVVSWMLRLGIWSWLITMAVKKLKPWLGDTPVGDSMQAPSGWTAGPAESAAHIEAFEPPDVPVATTTPPPVPTADRSEDVETVTETISESTEIWGAPSVETGGVEDVPAAAPPGVELAQEPEPEAEPEVPFVPRWIQGDGSVNCPGDFPIKAKAHSMIYYAPGTYHYSVAIPDVCFSSPEDAAAAGYRAPKR